jgi:gamma-glutamylcyclotransferase (GGCT)/AIG2-like uncharacterized protein YtfP
MKRNPIVTNLFVYGTLKRGQCREKMWPRTPRSIRKGFVFGWLYDLGPYPALWCAECGEPDAGQESCDWVEGEIWSFHRDDVAETVEELDVIEETCQPGLPNLYDQILVRVYTAPLSIDPQASSELALAYQYSRLSDIMPSTRIRPSAKEVSVIWPARG